jgi:hypothetical protein
MNRINNIIGGLERLSLCAIPFCGRPVMRSVGIGHAEFHCRYHVQFKARHGSHWHPTYKASELQPYLTVAAEWINERREETPVAYLSNRFQARPPFRVQ